MADFTRCEQANKIMRDDNSSQGKNNKLLEAIQP